MHPSYDRRISSSEVALDSFRLWSAYNSYPAFGLGWRALFDNTVAGTFVHEEGESAISMPEL